MGTQVKRQEEQGGEDEEDFARDKILQALPSESGWRRGERMCCLFGRPLATVNNFPRRILYATGILG